MAELLLSKGANVNESVDSYRKDYTVLNYVKGERMLRVLISHGADPIDYWVPFDLIRTAEKLWIEKYGVNGKNKDGRTLLHRAARHGDEGDGEWLISQSADINAKNNNGNTPLIYAAWNDSLKIGELLISKGADINAKNNNGNTPLHYAAWNSSWKIGELLISKGADISAKNNNGETPLDYTKKESKRRSVTQEDKKKMEQLLLPKGQ